MNEETRKMLDYLRVYDDEEADFIESLMTTAKIYIESMCGTVIKSSTNSASSSS